MPKQRKPWLRGFRVTVGRSFVAFRDNDPWNACEVRVVAIVKRFKDSEKSRFRCRLPLAWRRIAKGKRAQARTFTGAELW